MRSVGLRRPMGTEPLSGRPQRRRRGIGRRSQSLVESVEWNPVLIAYPIVSLPPSPEYRPPCCSRLVLVSSYAARLVNPALIV